MKEIWHKHLLRVHYKETDQMGVVHHANYVSWFEIARTEWMRKNGIAYSKMEELGLMLPVLDVNVNYKKSALYDQTVALYAKVKTFTPIRLEFYYEARLAGEAHAPVPEVGNPMKPPQGKLLATGSSMHMWLNDQWKPVRINHGAPKIYHHLNQLLED